LVWLLSIDAVSAVMAYRSLSRVRYAGMPQPAIERVDGLSWSSSCGSIAASLPRSSWCSTYAER
jgi:hypothetical protein